MIAIPAPALRNLCTRADCSPAYPEPAVATAKAAVAAEELDLRLDCLDEVTTVPTLAGGGEPSTWVAKLLRGVDVTDSASVLSVITQTKA